MHKKSQFKCFNSIHGINETKPQENTRIKLDLCGKSENEKQNMKQH